MGLRANVGWVGLGLAAFVGLFVAGSSGACGSKGGATGGTGGRNSGAMGGRGMTWTGSGGMAGTGSAGVAGTGGMAGTGSGGMAGTGSGGVAGTGSAGAAGTGLAGTGAAGSTGTIASGDSVLMHHKNLSRDGVYVQPALTKAAVAASLNRDPNFNAVLDSNEAVFTQPLFVDGGTAGPDLLIVATERNNVYALDGASGAQIWRRNLGMAVPLSTMPCGNIDPYGVTGTPVIDFASRTLFVDGLTTPDGGATKKHLIFALSIDDGSVRTGWPIDVGAKATSGSTTFNNAPQSQRGALAVVNGTLYVPYGGLYGDCGDYHGWLVAVSISDPSQVRAWATTARAGGSWAPGGVSSDGTDVYITTGNTSGASMWGGGEGLLRFTAGASFATPTYWAPMNWLALDTGDLDVGGSGAVLIDLAGSVPSSLAVALGKDGNAYLLDRNNLRGVGDPVAMAHVATAEIINAAAVYTTALATYVVFAGNGAMCLQGSGNLSTVKIMPGSPPTLSGSWCAKSGTGSPMVTTSDGHANAIVWTFGADTTQPFLNAFDGDTGAPIAYPGMNISMQGLRRYNTPIAAKGRIYVPTDRAIVAFKG